MIKQVTLNCFHQFATDDLCKLQKSASLSNIFKNVSENG